MMMTQNGIDARHGGGLGGISLVAQHPVTKMRGRELVDRVVRDSGLGESRSSHKEADVFD